MIREDLGTSECQGDLGVVMRGWIRVAACIDGKAMTGASCTLVT
jgi:hypothetical protein